MRFVPLNRQEEIKAKRIADREGRAAAAEAAVAERAKALIRKRKDDEKAAKAAAKAKKKSDAVSTLVWAGAGRCGLVEVSE